jgi:hypothetical protein
MAKGLGVYIYIYIYFAHAEWRVELRRLEHTGLVGVRGRGMGRG